MKIRRSYKYNYILTEQELRRIFDTVEQQIKKKQTNYQQSFVLLFKNGGEEELQDLDKIFSMDNGGQWTIQKLSIDLEGNDQSTLISLEFVSGFTLETTIWLFVQASDRDWVYVTVSLLEERWKAMRRGEFINRTRIDSCLMVIGVVSLVLGGVLLGNGSGASKPINLLFSVLLILFGIVSVPLGMSMNNFYLVHNQVFCWGDMADRYDKIKTIKNIVLIGVVLTLVLGIIGSLIASYIYRWLN